jgi:nuclear pore complex protein Nup188
LCQDYWLNDFELETRRAILLDAPFPRSTQLLELLISLSGQAYADSFSHSLLEIGPTLAVYREFASLSALTLPLENIGEYRTTLTDSNDRMVIKTVRSLVLPGGEIIPSGTTGIVSPPTNGSRRVRLDVQVDGWPMLFEILRATVGLSRHDQPITSADDRYIPLNVSKLGIESSLPAIQSCGLRLLEKILHPINGLPRRFFETLSTGIEPPAVAILEIILGSLEQFKTEAAPLRNVPATLAGINCIRHLLSLGDASVWTALRSSYFFGALGKRKSIAASLIHLDAAQGDHVISLAILRLVGTIVTAASTTSVPDERIVRPAVDLVYHSIWAQASGWRFNDGAKKYEMYSSLSTIFAAILAHPLSTDGTGRNEPAESLHDLFVANASSMTYRPLLDILIGGVDQAVKYMDRQRQTDAGLVVSSFENALVLLIVLLRNAVIAPSNTLPKSLMSTPIITPSGIRTNLVDHLLQIGVDPDLPASTRLRLFQLIRTFLLATNADKHRPSLAALLRHPDEICVSVGDFTTKGETEEIRALAWNLLATIVSTQPGCAKFCIGQSEDNLSPPLANAVEQTSRWSDLRKESPRILAAISNYCLAVVESPSSTSVDHLLRSHPSFSTSMFELLTSPVPTPPTFLLSMQTEDFAERITAYAHSVQARANATSLLAAELSSLADSDDPQVDKTKSVQLVVGLFRSGTKLAENIVAAAHTSCFSHLHEKQGAVLKEAGVSLDVLRTIAIPGERELGLSYLFGTSSGTFSLQRANLRRRASLCKG